MILKANDKTEMENKMLEAARNISIRIAPIYEKLNWQWCSHLGRYVPTACDILLEFARLIKCVLDESVVDTYVATGGLFVSIKELGDKWYEGEVGFQIMESTYVYKS